MGSWNTDMDNRVDDWTKEYGQMMDEWMNDEMLDGWISMVVDELIGHKKEWIKT